MNMMQVLLKEHSASMRDAVTAYVGKDSKRFARLVDLFLAGPYRVTQRAAWPLSFCVEKHPELIVPHLGRIVKNIDQPDLSDSVKRNTVRLLQFIQIPRRYQGRIAAVCFSFVQNTREAIAIRVFSMTVLANIAREQPELQTELRLILEDMLPYGSAGLVSRARKILRQMDQAAGVRRRKG